MTKQAKLFITSKALYVLAWLAMHVGAKKVAMWAATKGMMMLMEIISLKLDAAVLANQESKS